MEGKGLTLLEKSAIGPQSQKTYAAELEEFTIYAVPRDWMFETQKGWIAYWWTT